MHEINKIIVDRSPGAPRGAGFAHNWGGGALGCAKYSLDKQVLAKSL